MKTSIPLTAVVTVLIMKQTRIILAVALIMTAGMTTWVLAQKQVNPYFTGEAVRE